MTMKQLTDHVIAVANANNIRIDNLLLHKIMYFAIGDYIKDYGITKKLKLMYDEPFECWMTGATIKSQYFRFCLYGLYSIRSDGVYDDKFKEFDEYILKYANQKLTVLVEENHKHSVWQNNKHELLVSDKRAVWTLEDIKKDFCA